MMNGKTIISLDGIKINQDNFKRPFLTLEENEGVAMLAKQGDCFLLIEQFRIPVDSVVRQLPGGGVKKGEQLEQAVKREFLEETGFLCGTVHFLGTLQPASWRTNEVTHVFFTEEVGEYIQQQLEAHERIKVIKLKIHDCLDQVKKNKLQDSELCFALIQAILQGFLKL